ncbi:unnamed protein product [Trypanosoma congolense IL3000]|uniref:WGS project CAEQ00000000 data, annotated contig 1813 n=1 Tax=Trypanosoma congolense (strain IL3000) TaxID=1068625 RepID=F9W939_TRYCI|nr:unnamed protein product [Trypanosoma congolense IL3000]
MDVLVDQPTSNDAPCDDISAQPDACHLQREALQSAAGDGAMELSLEDCSLREIYKISCQQLAVRPDERIIRQLPPVAGEEWTDKIKALDFTATYVGSKGCLALVPLLERCPNVTHLLMPNVGLTREAAAPLLAVARSHPNLTWVDLSRNRLDDSVGRWILSAVLGNRNIRFVMLRDAGISLPLIQKIENTLSKRMRRESGGMLASTALPSTSNVEGGSPYGEFPHARTAVGVAGTPMHYISTAVAAGLAELRHLLFCNRESMQNVYDYFTRSSAGECDGASFRDGECSWESFFCGLKLLGVQAVTGSISDSVAFANVCGVCNIEAVCFGRLLQFLRPHAMFRGKLGHQEPLSPGGAVKGNCPPMPTDVVGSRNVAVTMPPAFHTVEEDGGVHPKLLEEAPSPGTAPAVVVTDTAAGSSFDAVSSGLTLQPTSNIFPFKMPSCEVSPTTSPVELRLKLHRSFETREKQTTADRLYDTREALREAIQKCESTEASASQRFIRFDAVLQSAGALIGASCHEAVASLVEPWVVEEESGLFVDTEGWLGALSLPQSNASALPPFSFEEEKFMWESVTTEELREAVGMW